MSDESGFRATLLRQKLRMSIRNPRGGDATVGLQLGADVALPGIKMADIIRTKVKPKYLGNKAARSQR